MNRCVADSRLQPFHGDGISPVPDLEAEESVRALQDPVGTVIGWTERWFGSIPADKNQLGFEQGAGQIRRRDWRQTVVEDRWRCETGHGPLQ